jgi:hypothetical protein
MATTEMKRVPVSWDISLLWTGVNALSIFGGILLGAFLNEILWRSYIPRDVDTLGVYIFINNPIQRAFIFGLSIGGIKSLLEWFVLQRYKAKRNGWISASLLGWTVGVTVAVGLAAFPSRSGINQLLGGMIIGFSQWIVLRHCLPKAYWWIIAIIVGSFLILSRIPLGYTFLMMLESFIAFIIAGLFMGIITGTTLSWLLTLSWLEEK